MNTLNNIPYANWLENSLKNLLETKVTSICLLSKTEDGEICAGYWNSSVADKILFAGMVQQDAMIDTLSNSGFLDELEDEEEYGEEE